MDYHLHLVERGGANINKRDFLRWRENGVAFKVTEDASLTDLVSNVTLISGEGAALGYWGDVMTGPFISYGQLASLVHCSVEIISEELLGVHSDAYAIKNQLKAPK